MFMGILDASFHLSADEQFYIGRMLTGMLDTANIPGRGNPASLPAALALEMESGFFTVGLFSPLDAGTVREVRAVRPEDNQVSVEAWSQSLVKLLLQAYPDLEPPLRLFAAKVFTDVLVGIGVPDRAAYAYPACVVREFWETDRAFG